jgi:hypothetical protein
MLNLKQIEKDNRFSGRSPGPPPMSPQEARNKANNILAQGLPPSLDKAVDFLSVGGIMTAHQLGISPRTLREHNKTRVVDRIPFNSPTIAETFRQYGLPIPEDQTRVLLYCLGPVGTEISKLRYDVKPPDGYLSYPLDRLMHDVVVNELVLQISEQAMARGWTPIWVSEKEATLYKENQPILKPDALVRIKKDGKEHLYLLEYHNEDKSTRAADKVRKYERAYASGIWRKDWDAAQFPPMLAVFRKPIVGRGYEEGLKERNRINCTYYGRLLGAALEDIDCPWLNIGTEEKEIVFPWAQAPFSISSDEKSG